MLWDYEEYYLLRCGTVYSGRMNFYHIPEDSNLHSHRFENLQYHFHDICNWNWSPSLSIYDAARSGDLFPNSRFHIVSGIWWMSRRSGQDLCLLPIWDDSPLYLSPKTNYFDWDFSCLPQLLQVVFLVSQFGVKLSPLGMSATIWPTVSAPDDSWWLWSSQWNEN
jgi:hypothetical protein